MSTQTTTLAGAAQAATLAAPASSARGVFVAVGYNGVRLYSVDGRKWVAGESGKGDDNYRMIAFGGGRFVAMAKNGGEGLFAASTDGRTWQQTKVKVGYGKGPLTIMHAAGKFYMYGGDPVSVGSGKPYVSTSTDGLQWSDNVDVGGKFVLRRVAHGNGLWVAVGDRGRRSVSADGLKWDDAPKIKATETLVDIAFGKGVFVGVGLHGLRMTTRDGRIWSSPVQGEEGEHLNSVVWLGDRFVAVGAGATYTSPSGESWKRIANQDAPTTVAYGNGVFVGSSWKGRMLVSTDGVAWKQAHKSDQHIEAVAFGSPGQ